MTKVMFFPKNVKAVKKYILEKYQRDFLVPISGSYFSFKSLVKEPSENDKEIMEEKMEEKMEDIKNKKCMQKEMEKISWVCEATGKGQKRLKNNKNKKTANKGIVKKMRKQNEKIREDVQILKNK